MPRFLLLIVLSCAGLLAGSAGLRADTPVDGRAGRAELRYLEGMMDHHQMALDMANDCLANTQDTAMIALCEAIISAQSAEIAQMQEWLLAWYNVQYAPVSMLMPTDDTMAGMDHSGHSMPAGPATDPAMMMGMMAGLNRLEGVAYDIAWLESMVDHHDDAIHMSQRLLARVPADAGHAALLALAQKIIDDQTAEIALMETMIAERAG
jgi:uncharacterized protein (DUF305 family)